MNWKIINKISRVNETFTDFILPTCTRLMKLVMIFLLFTGMIGCVLNKQNSLAESAIVIDDMGSFSIAGTILGDPDTGSLSCDHGYVEYLVPSNPRAVSLLMWHSSSTKVWQNRWDGGEGYQSIFLRRGYPVYLWDGPRVGRANWGCELITYTPIIRDQENFTAWRFGPYFMHWYPHLQFPIDDAEAWNQATRARYNEFDSLENAQLQSEAAALAVDRIGPTVALTSSAGGWRALMARLKSDNIVGIVAYETPGFIFPEGEGLEPDLDARFGPISVPLAEFMKLTQIPIQLVFGDNTEGTVWEQRLNNARLFAEIINAHGGDAEVLLLPDVGLMGNSHIPMADLNNQAVADLLSEWLHRKGLDLY